MKRSILFILFTLFLAVSVVLALHIAAPKKENHKHAGFDRVFAPDDILQPLDTLDLRYNSYYFAGVDSSKVYLGNYTAFTRVLEAKLDDLKDTTHHRIKTDNIRYKSIKVIVDSPYFYLTDGNVPFIYKGNITNWNAFPYMDNSYFTRALPISDSIFALTGYKDLNITFAKIHKGKQKAELFKDLLEGQNGEAAFSTDGMLHYDKNNEQLVYVYYYRNQYLCLDQNFGLKYKGKTIDTISQAKIKVGEISSKNQLTMSSPPLAVNKKQGVWNDHLYVNSNILAQNDDIDTFESSSVIDIYDLTNKKYLFSFYIPPYQGGKLKEFKVTSNGLLLVRYERYLVSYTLTPNNFGLYKLLNT